ncbi:MAG: glutathione transferase GstA [Hyphomicrobiales bacterium]
MKLYFSPGACSLSPHIVLREIGQKFDLAKVDLGSKKTDAGEDYTKVNPKGYVPALEIKDGEVLTEGPAIVQYLADNAKATNILPAPGTMGRYRAMEWLNFITSEIHKAFGSLFGKTLNEDARKAAIDRLSSRFGYLDQHLTKSKYLLGDAFSVADAYLWTCLRWAKGLGIDLDKWTHLSDYVRRIGERPSVRDAMKAEGLA